MRNTLPKSFKAVFISFLAAGLAGSAAAQVAGFKNFEIVESAPVETTMDNPDVRNARDVWLEMIAKAKRTLDIEQFYISNEPNEPLEDIIQAVVEAGKRGVRVRIVADKGMSATYPHTLEMLGRQKNISVRLIDYRKVSGGTQHAKFFIVDGEDLFMGSQNFDWRALAHIYELGVRITDPRAAKVFGDIFEIDWALSGPEGGNFRVAQAPVPAPFVLSEGDDPLTYSPTFSPKGFIPDESLWDETQLVRMIDSAKTELYFHVLTYSPAASKGGYYEVLDNALRRAAARGVKVRVMCADWSKRKPAIDHLKSLGVIPNIAVKLSTIPEWSGGFIPFARVDHSKFLVVDDRLSWIGTSNWEKSYFHNGRNIGVVADSKAVNAILKRIYLKNWNSAYSYFVRPEVEYTPPETDRKRSE